MHPLLRGFTPVSSRHGHRTCGRGLHPTRHLPAQLEPAHVTTYRTGINAFRNAVGNDSELTKTDLQHFVISMRERGLTAGGCNMYIRTINGFLTWLHEDGRVPARQRVKLLTNPPKALAGFSDTEMRRVVALRPTGRIERRSWSPFVCLLDTGIRITKPWGSNTNGSTSMRSP